MNQISTEFRTKVADLEALLKAGGSADGITITPIDPPECTHHFIPGVYIREIRIPAGTALTGRIHKTEHLCIINGDCEISSVEGHKRYTGHNSFVSHPGVKRAIYTHSDVVFMTVHRTDETDPDKLFDLMTAETYEEFDRLELTQQHFEVLP